MIFSFVSQEQSEPTRCAFLPQEESGYVRPKSTRRRGLVQYLQCVFNNDVLSFCVAAIERDNSACCQNTVVEGFFSNSTTGASRASR